MISQPEEEKFDTSFLSLTKENPFDEGNKNNNDILSESEDKESNQSMQSSIMLDNYSINGLNLNDIDRFSDSIGDQSQIKTPSGLG